MHDDNTSIGAAIELEMEWQLRESNISPSFLIINLKKGIAGERNLTGGWGDYTEGYAAKGQGRMGVEHYVRRN